MRIKRIIMLCFMCLLISGCHADYELNVSNDAIEDKVYFTLKSDDYEKAIFINQLFQISNMQYTNDEEIGKVVIDKLRNDTLIPGYNIDGAYVRKVKNDDISLSFLYQGDSFEHSYIFNNCFDNFIYDSNSNYYVIQGAGAFKCLVNDKESIAIQSDYQVINHNADKVVGNKYIWNFDRKNNLNHELYIQISKKYKAPKNNYWSFIVLGIILIGMFIYKFFLKKDRKSIFKNNEV